MTLSLFLSAVLATAVLISPAAKATPITIHNTGTVSSGADPYYIITASNDPSVPAYSPAYIDTSWAGGWASAINGTDWINPSASGMGGQNFGIYSYTYTTSFDLTGFDPTTAVLSGLLQADDEVTLFLNGHQVSTSNVGTYTRATAFTVGSNYSSDFQSGVNTLSFLVTNSGNYATGFDAAISGMAVSEAPENGSFTMVLLAGVILSGVGLHRRRGQRAA